MGRGPDPARVRVGLDLVEVERLARLIERWGERFLERVFTPGELQACLPRRRAAEHLAARFAAKEALVKAAGLRRAWPWREIEVASRPWGEPYFSRLPEGLDPGRARLSLAHAAGLAVAVVVLIPED
jgi:holo-[acyl-carrier protein] synthase